MLKISRISRPVFFEFLLVFVIYFFVGLCIYYSLNLDFINPSHLEYKIAPTDGLTYIKISQLFYHQEYQDLTLLQVFKGSLNWLFLPGVYFQLNSLFANADVVVIFLNTIFVSLTFILFRQSLKDKNLLALLFLFIITQPYLLLYILVPNKDIPLLFCIFLLTKLYTQSQLVKYTGVMLFFGLFKFQIIIASVLLFLSRRKKGLLVAGFLLLSFIYPYLLKNNIAINISDFSDVATENIRTIYIANLLETISSYPFGFVLASPLRVILNLVSGLARIGDIFSSEFIQSLSIISSATLSFLFIKIMISTRLKFKKLFYFLLEKYPPVIFYILVLSLIPFFQIRYYWFLIPIFVHFSIYEESWRRSMSV